MCATAQPRLRLGELRLPALRAPERDRGRIFGRGLVGPAPAPASSIGADSATLRAPQRTREPVAQAGRTASFGRLIHLHELCADSWRRASRDRRFFLETRSGVGRRGVLAAGLEPLQRLEEVFVWTADGRRRRVPMAARAASWQSDLMSAGDIPSVSRASSSSRTPTVGIRAVLSLSTASRLSSSGRPRTIVRDSRPPRSSAGLELVGSVRRADDEDAALARDPVDLGEQLVDLRCRAPGTRRAWPRSRRSRR